jgi:hypothetical protein
MLPFTAVRRVIFKEVKGRLGASDGTRFKLGNRVC